jgi:hypothetical protein
MIKRNKALGGFSKLYSFKKFSLVMLLQLEGTKECHKLNELFKLICLAELRLNVGCSKEANDQFFPLFLLVFLLFENPKP